MQTVAAVNDATARARLSGPAVRAYLKLASLWALDTEEQIDLLGASVSRGTLRNWALGKTEAMLSADQLMRISFLLGIYEGLQRIWRRAPAEADLWLRRSRSEGPFRGLAPIAYMRQGGIPALSATRSYVDGMTAGPPSRTEYVSPPREEI